MHSMKEYKEATTELKKDLPLLVGEIVTPDGLKELESRLKGEAK